MDYNPAMDFPPRKGWPLLIFVFAWWGGAVLGGFLWWPLFFLVFVGGAIWLGLTDNARRKGGWRQTADGAWKWEKPE